MTHPVPTDLTVEQLRAALPDKVRKSVTPQLLSQIQQTLSDPEMWETYRDNLLTYGQVMADGKFKVEQYINAVKYVSYKLAGLTSYDAYSKTFPAKMAQRRNAEERPGQLHRGLQQVEAG